MLRLLLPLWSLTLFSTAGVAQMVGNGQDTLYGNEWIRDNQPYFKFKVAEDGVYRIGYDVLTAAAIPVTQIEGSRYQLFRLGEETPLFVSSGESPLGPADFLEFVGRKNRGELDRFLYADPGKEQFNPEYSLYSDTSVYFLTWGNAAGKRVENLVPDAAALAQSVSVADLTVYPLFPETGSHSLPPLFGSYPLHGTYTLGEGFGTSRNFRYTKTLTLDGLDAQQAIRLSFRMNSWPESNQVQVLIQNQPVLDTTLNGPFVQEFSFALPPGTAVGNKLTLEVKTTRLSAIAWVRAAYAKTLGAGTKPENLPFTFALPAGAASFAFPWSGAAQPFLLYTADGAVRRETRVSNGTAFFAAAGWAPARTLVLAEEKNIRPISSLQAVQPAVLAPKPLDYLIVTAAPFIQGAAQAYAAYRASAAGGGYSPQAIDFSSLTDPFAYGIPNHPLALKNYLAWLKKQGIALKYLFFIGKGLEYPAFRKQSALPQWFVPTYGTPASDHLFAAPDPEKAPEFPVGRLAATDPEQVLAYLEKVREYETAALHLGSASERYWPKRALHLAGGQTEGEKIAIRYYLDQGAGILAQAPLGGETVSYYKNSSDIVQQSPTEEITRLINEGVSVITFFGHSSSNTFDYSINEPQSLDNAGRYPILFALGCNAGQIFNNYKSLSESYVFEPRKGAAAFVGTSSVGYLNALGEEIQAVYQSMNRLGGPETTLGLALKGAFEAMADRHSTIELSLVQTTILHGDPALKLPFAQGPDWVIDSKSAVLSPAVVSAATDSLTFAADLLNLGAAIPDSLELLLEWTNEQGQTLRTHAFTVPSPSNRQSIRLRFPFEPAATVGNHYISLTLDPLNKIGEWPAPFSERNNTLALPGGSARLRFFVFAHSLTPLVPPPYGVLTRQPAALLASTSNPLDRKPRGYIFELDSTETFDSPLLQQAEVNSLGGIVRWPIPVPLQPDQTYFWRVSQDSSGAGAFAWQNSSFTYAPQRRENWLMRHFQQWDDNRYAFLNADTLSRQLVFANQVSAIRVLTGRYPDITRPEVAVNNFPSRFFPFNNPAFDAGFYAAVFDGLTGAPWYNQLGGLYGSQIQKEPHNALLDFIAFPYSTSKASSRAALIDFLEKTVPDGHYVLLFTVSDNNRSLQAGTWAQDSAALGKNLFSLLERQGARQIRTLAAAPFSPYIFFFRKNRPDFLPTEIAGQPEELISASWTLEGPLPSGTATSPAAGPARQWSFLEWGLKPGEIPSAADQASVSVIGINPQGLETRLLESLPPGKTDLSAIDASAFPKLKLEYLTTDSFARTPLQPAFWGIAYEPVAELALDPARFWKAPADTLAQGEPLRFETAISNLGPEVLDGITLEYSVLAPGLPREAKKQKLPRIMPDSFAVASLEIPTTALSAPSQVFVVVNPEKDPEEITYDNNQGQFAFDIRKDEIPPVLHVTFDGRTLLHGELVPAQPVIQIRLRDENPYLVLADTGLLEVTLTPPSSGKPQRLSYRSDLEFEAATAGTRNEAQIWYRPTLTESGRYALEVQGRDASGNKSGALSYRVEFEVDRTKALRELVNYPNPFSTYTRFAYLLSGDEAPARYRIRVYSVSGRIVRELTEADLGPLEIGKHLTHGGWDGTDDFGQPLANGVYLYQFLLDDEHTEFLKYPGGVAKNQFHKLVILR
jgi:hypothetical protein